MAESYTFSTPPVRRADAQEMSKEWDNLGFQIRPVNGYVKYTHKGGKWSQAEFVPAPYTLLHVNSGALHYGISCFEGLKAFSCRDGHIRLLNPSLNAARMQRGARRLRMPEVPPAMFVEGCCEAVRRNAEFVPPYGRNASMYVRPLLFASGPMLGLTPLAEEYTFMVLANPVGGYFSSSAGEEGIDALVMEDYDRAAPYGTGNVKAAGNYAADLEPLYTAKEKGFGTTLYLDAKERRYVEEFSVANFVGITKDGKFVTPQADSSVLGSTTNRMLQQLAKDRGITVEQRPIDFDAEIGNFAEVGMVGTAAVLMKVKSITRGDRVYKFGEFGTLGSLRSALTALQAGESPDTHGWMFDVCPARSKL